MRMNLPERIQIKNINEAMCNLHTPIRRPSETWKDYKAWQAASACLCKQHAADIVEQQTKCAHITIVNELNQLLDEQEEYDALHHKSTGTYKRNHPASNRDKSNNLHRDKEMQCREHYINWLSTQNVLDSMRYDDLQNTGKLNISNRNKRPTYGGYPRLNSVRCLRSNTPPGPSCPRDNNNMGDDSSEPSDDSDHSDSTYRRDESEDTDTTVQDTDEDSSSSDENNWRRTHRHRRRDSDNPQRCHAYDDHRRK